MSQESDRFRGFQQLVGDLGFAQIASASICVIGLGGVGSWTVEALARCGVGSLALVDLDEVCVTNINRQIHALTESVGRSKALLLKERVLQIHPECKVTAIQRFFTGENADSILLPEYDLIIDTIDSVDHKTDLILECVRRDLPVITVGSGGERIDPLAIEVVDLACTLYDPLLQIVRKRLRQQHNFPRGDRKRFNIPCVYAPLQRGPRVRVQCQADEGEVGTGRKSCNDGLGSAVFVTGTLGFIVASEAIKMLQQGRGESPYPWRDKRWGVEKAIKQDLS